MLDANVINFIVVTTFTIDEVYYQEFGDNYRSANDYFELERAQNGDIAKVELLKCEVKITYTVEQSNASA